MWLNPGDVTPTRGVIGFAVLPATASFHRDFRQLVDDSLSAYRAKRSSDTSPEPIGTVSPVPGRLFVVHKHAATRLHFDLRLEMNGVLRSWAVPKGPSYDTNDKRLAVKVEDHPLEYGDFEGIIPKGNYGAGGVIVWDRGEWVPLEDWREGFEKGKLLFELRGYKLHGKWTLVKIKKSERDWLLIKERDSFVASPGDQFDETSVLSGLTVEEVKAGRSPVADLRAKVEKAGAAHARVDPTSVEVMLAEPADNAFTRDGWVFELKLDGYRLIASKSRGEALLLTRNGNDYTAVFPEIARAIKALPFDECIVDGEVVVLDASGKPSFARLQQRGRLSSTIDIKRAAVELPATFYAFDLLAFEDFDLRPLPLTTRKALLMDALPKLGAVRTLDHIKWRPWVSRVSSPSAPTLRTAAAEPMHGSRSNGNAPVTSSSSALPGRKGRAATWARCSSPTWSTERWYTPVASALGSMTRCSPRSKRCSTRSSVAIRRAGHPSAPARSRFRRSKRRRGSIRRMSVRSASANGRPTACCDTRRSCACVMTRIRATASVNAPPPK
jgi:DNA ligase D-like protein (predicted 3'-phosphoesterase)